MSIEYRQDGLQGWVPKSWVWHDFNEAGKLVSAYRYEVSKWSVNQPIPDQDFEITFPVGAWVNEHIKGVDRVFIVLNDGTKRHFSRAEAATAEHERLMQLDAARKPPGK